MQTRYLIQTNREPVAAAVWAARLTRQLGGRTVSLGDRCLIWTNDGAPVSHLMSGRSIVVGRLHPHPEGLAASPFPDALAAVTNWGGLVRVAWGAYVAIELGNRCDTPSVFRAPMGALPCYHCETQDGWAFCSDVDLLVDAGLLDPRIEWEALARQMASAMGEREETCLSGLRELPQGCAMHLEGGRPAGLTPVWSYWDHVAVQPRSMSEWTDRLRARILGSVRAMTSEYQTVTASVSGGLDSSIVLACLQRLGGSVHPFTLVGTDPDADETGYVRPLARHLGMELIEYPFDAADVDLSRSSVGHLPRPIGQTHAQTVAAKHRLAYERFGADAVFTGMGGDSIFCTSLSALPLVDRLRAEGPGLGLVETFSAVRRITRAPAHQIAWQAARIALRGRRPNWRSPIEDFLAEHLRGPGVDPLAAAWLKAPAKAFLGKVYHVEMLARTLPGVEGFDRARHPAFLSPLLSQPVVETCLRIPTWIWSASGLPRAVAREAFRPWLPAIIVDRRSKGGPDSFSRDLFMAHKQMLREMLLDGQLVHRDILDRSVLEDALREKALLAQSRHSHLLHLVDVEAWIAHWGAAGVARVARPTRIASQRA